MIKSILVFFFAVSAQAHFELGHQKLTPVMDGRSVNCALAGDVGQTGMFFKNLKIEEEGSSQWLTVVPMYVRCALDAKKVPAWIEVSEEEAQTTLVKDGLGNKYRITIEARELVAQINDVDSFVGKAAISGDKNVAIDVRVFELLKQRYSDELSKAGKVQVPVDLAIRNTLAIYNEQNEMVDRYYNFSGWYRVQLTVSE